MTNFEPLLASPYLRAFLLIFRKQFLYSSFFDERQGWKVSVWSCVFINIIYVLSNWQCRLRFLGDCVFKLPLLFIVTEKFNTLRYIFKRSPTFFCVHLIQFLWLTSSNKRFSNTHTRTKTACFEFKYNQTEPRYSMKGVRVLGPKIWNKLPSHLKPTLNLLSLTRLIKS